MSAINNGNQQVTYDYKQAITSQGFNKVNYKLHPKGIYEGGEVVKVNDSEIRIQPFVCLYEDTVNKVSVKIETDTYAVVAVSASTPYVVGRFTWLNTEDNYMDIVAIAQAELVATDVIFARLQFTGAILSTDYDYSEKSWTAKKCLKFCETMPFMVTPTYPNSTTVKVGVGGPVIVDGKKVEILVEATSPTVVLPVGVDRKDLVVIDTDGNSIKIIEGTTIIPILTRTYLPVAILNLPSDCTAIKGSYIEYIHPSLFKSNNTPASEILTLTLAQDGAGSNLDGYSLDSIPSNDFITAFRQISFITPTSYQLINMGIVPVDIAYGNGIYVAVGWTSGTVCATAVSSNLIDWEVSSAISGATNNASYAHIAFGQNRFVISTSQGVLQYSSDGLNWSNNTGGLVKAVRSLIFGGDRFVAVGTNGVRLYSLDGMSWTDVSIVTSNDFNGLSYGNGVFVHGGGVTGFYSSDGITWTASSTNVNTYFVYSTFSNNYFYAFGEFSSSPKYSKLIRSVDGNVWEDISLNIIGKVIFNYCDMTQVSIQSSNGILYLSIGNAQANLISYNQGVTWAVGGIGGGPISNYPLIGSIITNNRIIITHYTFTPFSTPASQRTYLII